VKALHEADNGYSYVSDGIGVDGVGVGVDGIGAARSSPPRPPGENLEPDFGSGGGGAATSFSSLGVSPRWFVESLVRMLESMVAAAQSMGFQGAMYIAAGAPGLTNSLVRFGPAAYSQSLRR
jgi:hypothetical protein